MIETNELAKKVRAVTEEDKDLPVFSYSKIEVFKSCPLKYKFKYIDKKFSDDTSLALELGSLCHYVLENKGKMLIANKEVDYEVLNYILEEGTVETDEKTKDKLLGVRELKAKYFDTWFKKDTSSNLDYEDKMKIFKEVFNQEMMGSDWKATYFERPFQFVWDNRVIIKGFIDRIDTKEIDGEIEYRTIDYKTSNKVYNGKLATSLQFGIYALAILNEFGKLPVESSYRFASLNKEQKALTKGYEKRLLKALDKTFDTIEETEKTKQFKPTPTPLCYFCDFCRNNPKASVHKDSCDFYSLWTPTAKTFDVNKKWDISMMVEEKTKRKLIF